MRQTSFQMCPGLWQAWSWVAPVRVSPKDGRFANPCSRTCCCQLMSPSVSETHPGRVSHENRGQVLEQFDTTPEMSGSVHAISDNSTCAAYLLKLYCRMHHAAKQK